MICCGHTAVQYLGLPMAVTGSLMNNSIDDFVQALITLDRLTAKQIAKKYKRNISAIKFVEEVVVVALERIGEDWQKGKLALSQVYMGGRICETLVDEFLPPKSPDRKDQPKMAICTLSDYHKLGKIIVYSLLRASGFELADYGTIEVDDLIDKIKKEEIKVLLISVLMLPSAFKIKKIKEKLIEMNLDVKIIVGGAPFRFDNQLYEEVGADAMCSTASEAVSVIQNVIGGVA